MHSPKHTLAPFPNANSLSIPLPPSLKRTHAIVAASTRVLNLGVMESTVKEVEGGLAVLERSLTEEGESSTRVREQLKNEMASEHPEVPVNVLEKVWRETGVLGGGAQREEREREKEAVVNENRAGRYNKKK